MPESMQQMTSVDKRIAEVAKMGMYKYIRDAWKSPKANILKGVVRPNISIWRDEPALVKIERPTRLDRARSLGYKAKEGIIIVRSRVSRGGRMKPKFWGGRRSKRMNRRKDLNLSYQTIAETRVQDKFVNCEILNSYYVAEDGAYYWYEVIAVDKNHPAIRADPNYKWITDVKNTNRVYRGLTASAKRTRGILTHKGKGAEKLRPSKNAAILRRQKVSNSYF